MAAKQAGITMYAIISPPCVNYHNNGNPRAVDSRGRICLFENPLLLTTLLKLLWLAASAMISYAIIRNTDRGAPSLKINNFSELKLPSPENPLQWESLVIILFVY